MLGPRPTEAAAAKWGIRCDGVTDDSAAVQLATNAVSAAGGGVIQLPAGTCLFAGPSSGPGGALIYLKSNVTYQGAGRGVTIFKLKDNQYNDVWDGVNKLSSSFLSWFSAVDSTVFNQSSSLNNVSFLDMTFDMGANRWDPGPNYAVPRDVLRLGDTSNVTIQRVDFLNNDNSNTIYSGLRAGRQPTNLLIEDCTFDQPTRNNPLAFDQSTLLISHDNAVVRRNRFINTAPHQRGRVLTTACELHGNNNRFVDNIVRGYRQAVFISEGDSPPPLTGIEVAGNVADDLNTFFATFWIDGIAPWAANTYYDQGVEATYDGRVYRTTNAGTSAASGGNAPPSCTTDCIRSDVCDSNGLCWRYQPGRAPVYEARGVQIHDNTVVLNATEGNFLDSNVAFIGSLSAVLGPGDAPGQANQVRVHHNTVTYNPPPRWQPATTYPVIGTLNQGAPGFSSASSNGPLVTSAGDLGGHVLRAIAPQGRSAAPVAAISTIPSSPSTTVTVNAPRHGCSTGEWVSITGASVPAYNGLRGPITRIDSNSFTFVHTQANLGESTGGAVSFPPMGADIVSMSRKGAIATATVSPPLPAPLRVGSAVDLVYYTLTEETNFPAGRYPITASTTTSVSFRLPGNANASFQQSGGIVSADGTSHWMPVTAYTSRNACISMIIPASDWQITDNTFRGSFNSGVVFSYGGTCATPVNFERIQIKGNRFLGVGQAKDGSGGIVFVQAAGKVGAVSNLAIEDNEIVNNTNQPDQIFSVHSTGVPVNVTAAKNRPIGFTPGNALLTFSPETPAPSNAQVQ